MSQAMSKFEEIYKKIAQKKYYVEPKYPRMDNWSVDIYETPTGFFARMSDSGYSREVGWKDSTGEVKWKVCDYYPAPLKFTGSMTEEDFINLSMK
jgi:hypothetical protein